LPPNCGVIDGCIETLFCKEYQRQNSLKKAVRR
jgi:hypothetical protein